VALHLRKIVDAWNDRGDGNFALCYVRDKERREVDFLITEGRKPWMLIETRVADHQISPALRYYRRQMKVPHAIQVVKSIDASYSSDGIAVVLAHDFLALI
jgi:diaminopimelate epimerase